MWLRVIDQARDVQNTRAKWNVVLQESRNVITNRARIEWLYPIMCQSKKDYLCIISCIFHNITALDEYNVSRVYVLRCLIMFTRRSVTFNFSFCSWVISFVFFPFRFWNRLLSCNNTWCYVLCEFWKFELFIENL